jgi:hypothetical protein
LFVTCQDGDEKLAGLLAQGADSIQLKSGVGIPDIKQKVVPRTGYQIILRSLARIFTSIDRTFKKSQLLIGRSEFFKNIVVARIEGLRPPHMLIWDTFFRFNVPLKFFSLPKYASCIESLFGR